MSPEEIRARVDEQVPRVQADGSTINARHVAMEQTLRHRYGHPSYIAELDGPGNFRPPAVSDADRAKAAEAQRKPLTALEWLRVTHADTLSGRRIEEAIAAALAEARAPYDRLTADLRALAEEWATHPWGGAVVFSPQGCAVRLRAVVAAAEEA